MHIAMDEREALAECVRWVDDGWDALRREIATTKIVDALRFLALLI